MSNLASDLLSQRAQLQYADEQARRGLAESAEQRAIQGVGLAEAMAAQPLARGQAAMAAGGLPRSLEQAQKDVEFQEFIRTQAESNPLLALAAQYLGITSQAAVPTFGPGQEAGSKGFNWGGALAGSAAMGIPLALLAASNPVTAPFALLAGLGGDIAGGYFGGTM